MGSGTLYFHGVDGETGRHLFPPTTTRAIAALAVREPAARGEIARLERWLDQLDASRRLDAGGELVQLAQAGWGIIFAGDDPTAAAVREALGELLAHRRAQAARDHEHYYQEYAGTRGYRRGESKVEFLARHGVGPGAADPGRMPYYLLLAGDPEVIPFGFQTQLDVEYAVGRICFDRLDDYAAYARSVVAAERLPLLRRRRAVLFAPRHPGDAATGWTAAELAGPLAAHMSRHRAGWEVATAFGAQATKARLASLLGGEDEAAFVFTAGHGIGYPSGHALQRARQGALLCQGFSGFAAGNGEVGPEHCFAGDDLGPSARVHGLVTFHAASFSAGAPVQGDFPAVLGGPLPRVAPRAFLSRLAQRLVGHPRGSALAVIGQVERTWQLPLGQAGAGRLVPAFAAACDRLLAGHPVGYAMEPFGERHARLCADLAAELEVARRGAPLDEEIVARLWTARNDCRTYAVIGDPAVRLAAGVRAEGEEEKTPPAETVN
jgi:hypothetical protein